MGAAAQIDALERSLDRVHGLLVVGDDVLSLRAPGVSGWSIGEQVDHILLSARRMLAAVEMLQAGEDERIVASGNPSMIARVLMLTGKIPRGRAKAPDEVVPTDAPDANAMTEQLRFVRAQIANIRPQIGSIRSVRGCVPHPMLGPFRAHHWVRFARVHTDHHMAIVDDIQANAR